MVEYNPRSKNPRVDGDNRNSWSTTFDKYVERKREWRDIIGFRLPEKEKS